MTKHSAVALTLTARGSSGRSGIPDAQAEKGIPLVVDFLPTLFDNFACTTHLMSFESVWGLNEDNRGPEPKLDLMTISPRVNVRFLSLVLTVELELEAFDWIDSHRRHVSIAALKGLHDTSP